MLIVFKSPASGDVIMFEKNGKEMLGVLGKDPADAKGIVTVEQLPGAIAAVRAMREGGVRLRRDLVVVDFLGEEPNDYGIACVGSRALAGVLASNPATIVADEPTTLLDLANTRRVGEELFNLDQQLILATHDLELAADADRVLVVEAGRVVADGPPDAALAAYVDLVSR